jgi:hypothetical protein
VSTPSPRELMETEEPVEPAEEGEEPVESPRKKGRVAKTAPVEDEGEELDLEEDDPDDDYAGAWDEDEADYAIRDNLEESAKRYWRPIAAYVYIAICVFDFVGMPLFMELQNDRVNTRAFAEIKQLEGAETQQAAIEAINLGPREWAPLTLEGGGLFHIAFGAILGVAAWTRGQEKRAALEFRQGTRTGLGADCPPGGMRGNRRGMYGRR